MIAFKAISYFLERVQALKEVKRGVYATVEEVGLLDVYPKNGPMQQLDIDDAEVVRLMQQYLLGKEHGNLMPYEI